MGAGMKLEIEITEDEIKSAIGDKVKEAIREQANKWGIEHEIKAQVKTHWNQAVDSLIKEALLDSKSLRQKIATALENKIRAQLTAALRNAEK